MLRAGKSPSGLMQELFETLGQTYHYDRIDRHFPAEWRPQIVARLNAQRPERLAGVPVRELVTVDGYKYDLGPYGWLLIRFSGTEPLLRVYCEVTDAQLVQPVLQAGLELAGLAELEQP